MNRIGPPKHSDILVSQSLHKLVHGFGGDVLALHLEHLVSIPRVEENVRMPEYTFNLAVSRLIVLTVSIAFEHLARVIEKNLQF